MRIFGAVLLFIAAFRVTAEALPQYRRGLYLGGALVAAVLTAVALMARPRGA